MAATVNGCTDSRCRRRAPTSEKGLTVSVHAHGIAPAEERTPRKRRARRTHVRIDEILSRARSHRARADALMLEAEKATAEATRLEQRARRKNDRRSDTD